MGNAKRWLLGRGCSEPAALTEFQTQHVDGDNRGFMGERGGLCHPWLRQEEVGAHRRMVGGRKSTWGSQGAPKHHNNTVLGRRKGRAGQPAWS